MAEIRPYKSVQSCKVKRGTSKKNVDYFVAGLEDPALRAAVLTHIGELRAFFMEEQGRISFAYSIAWALTNRKYLRDVWADMTEGEGEVIHGKAAWLDHFRVLSFFYSAHQLPGALRAIPTSTLRGPLVRANNVRLWMLRNAGFIRFHPVPGRKAMNMLTDKGLKLITALHDRIERDFNDFISSQREAGREFAEKYND